MPACKCTERNRPMFRDLPKGSNERPRQWFTILNNQTSHGHWSDYSVLACRVCGGYWKTKAKYVLKLQRDEYFPKDTAPRVPAFETIK